MIEVRFHGRGGQGAKLASRILGRSGFLSGLYAQDFALFGAERRGAHVVYFTRLSSEPIDRRGSIDRPDLIVVMDHSLLSEAPGQVFHGVVATTSIIVNAEPQAPPATDDNQPEAKYFFIDMDRVAQQLIGAAFVSATAAAAAAKCIPGMTVDRLAEAVRGEIAELGLTPDLIEKNLVAARAAYDHTAMLEIAGTPADSEVTEPAWQAVPYLASARFAGPAIRHPASAALRQTGNWRTERPVIELAKCKRCFLCYLYCPDAALRLDEENFPHVDYDHCKGCMICYEECPTDAITRRMES